MRSSTATHTPLVDLRAQYEDLRDEIDEAIESILGSSTFIGGPPVTKFENAFAQFCGVPHVVGVANGTDALELTLLALNVGEGDEVLVPTLTFAATAEAVVNVGARPVFVDCDPKTLNMSAEAARSLIGPATRAIIVVHLYGQPADMDAWTALADERGLLLIEDAAQAHGARWREAPVGSFGVAGTFSFYPGKNLGAYGDAGAVIAPDPHLAERVRKLANHGRLSKYEHDVSGRNSRLDSLQAAILEVKLRHLERWTVRRREIAARYRKKLKETVPMVVQDARAWSVYHLFVVLVEHRDSVRAALKEEGIATGVHYPIPLHRQPAFAQCVDPGRYVPRESELVTPRLLSLPLYPELADCEVDRIVDVLIHTVQRHS